MTRPSSRCLFYFFEAGEEPPPVVPMPIAVCKKETKEEREEESTVLSLLVGRTPFSSSPSGSFSRKERAENGETARKQKRT